LSETANVVSARPREARAGKSAKFLGTPKTVFKILDMNNKKFNNFLKDPRTNWKYILIVVIFTSIVGGGILGYQYWWAPKREVKVPEEIIKPVEEEAEMQLTLETLKNADYYCQWYDMKIQLNNGRYIKEYPDSASVLNIGIFNNMVALGDLNNDEKKDAAVILDSSGGGSGHFYELAIIINKGGKPFYLTSEKLGDRVIINSIVIQSGKIILDMITHGPNDGMCCPTLKKVIGYELSGNQLLTTILVEDETADWKTYQSSKMGFSIKCPANFKVFLDIPIEDVPSRDLFGNSFFIEDEITKKELILVHIDSWTKFLEEAYGEGFTFQDWINQEVELFKSEDPKLKQEDFVLNNNPAIKISFKDQYRNQMVIIIYIQKEERMYEITAWIDTEHQNIYLPIFNQMLSTFRFLE